MGGAERDKSFAEFVALRWTALYRMAYLLTGDPGAADDILQATLVKVFTSWNRVTRADAPEAYVRRMLVNTFVSAGRGAASQHERAQDQLPETSVPSPETAVVERVNLWAYVTDLPPRQRAVIVLRYYEDLSERQIADTLQCSTGTVKSQAADALRRLRARVGSEPESEGTLR